ncbi:MAG: CPBP family intramembrane metalloprotease [Acidobacteriia bacterium]|nr:CPBP family intramembrane metalloprotease [Terriglobia bacterium]
MDSTEILAGPVDDVQVQRSAASSSRRRWEDLSLVVLIAVVPLFLSAAFSLFYPAQRATQARLWGGTASLIRAFSSVVLILYVLNRRGQNLASIGFKPRWLDLAHGVGLTLGGLFLSTVFAVIVWKSSFYTDPFWGMRDARTIFAGETSVMFFLTALFSSVFEETVVRAFVMTDLMSLSCPVWLAAAASVVLQTSYHLYYGVGGALVTSGVFIVFACYFAVSRRLAPLIVAHLAFDIVAGLPRFFS